jgi:heavy metal sensor kinase
MSRTVGGRIAGLTAGLCALGLGGFAGSLYLWVREAERRELQATAATQLQVFSEQFVEEYEEHRKGALPDLSAMLDAVLSGAGCIARATRTGGATVYVSEDYDRKAAGFLRVSARVRASSGEDFDLSVGVDPASIEQSLAQLRTYFAVFIPVVVVLTAALAHVGVRRALAPLEDIRRQAERISRQNVSERIPLGPLYGELHNLARTFNEMLERLDQAIQDLQNFAADAAHELRTPLATLRAEVETAVQQAQTREEHERILLSVSEEVSRMTGIVTDLLTLARMDLRQYALKKERVELRAILEETRETWQPLADERGVRIRLEGPEADVPGDPIALRRVFMNLVHNAVKYNREGGTVLLSLQNGGARATVRVEDTGMGIAPEHLPRLFRRFYRVDQARSRDSGGAGLGLALCKSFIDAHQGSIQVSSDEGAGTCFTVDLPALAPPGAGA